MLALHDVVAAIADIIEFFRSSIAGRMPPCCRAADMVKEGFANALIDGRRTSKDSEEIMKASSIDHIVITAPTLQDGAAYVRHVLGVDMQTGGEHPRMGTHNLLLRLDDALFLEVIAINSVAPSPGRPRWFALDRLAPDALPSLSTWVVHTGDIRASVSACSESLGDIAPMSRGTLNWLITIPDDGSVPLDGIAPALIEWNTDVHPASRLDDLGLSLHGLDLFHPDPERVTNMLASLKLEGPVTVRPTSPGVAPHLVAHVNTPNGLRTLSAPAFHLASHLAS